MRNIFTQAHKLTKSIITQGDDYRATFALALKVIYGGISMTTINNEQNFLDASADERRAWMNSLRKEIIGTEEQVKVINETIDAFIEEAATMRERIARRKKAYECALEAFGKFSNADWLIYRNLEKAEQLYPAEFKAYKAKLEKKYADIEAREKAREEADIKERAERNDGFPELKGTIKQVAWANDIRRAMCTKKLGHAFDDVQSEALKSVNRAKTAKYWIDNYKHVYKKYI